MPVQTDINRDYKEAVKALEEAIQVQPVPRSHPGEPETGIFLPAPPASARAGWRR